VLKIWENYITELHDRPNRPVTLEAEPKEEVDAGEKGPYIRRAQVKVGLINLCKGLFSLNARIYYSIAHRRAVCNLPGGYSTILPHKGVHCSN
jgi:hypothetical protein